MSSGAYFVCLDWRCPCTKHASCGNMLHAWHWHDMHEQPLILNNWISEAERTPLLVLVACS
jgi:hypothetical protein